MEADQILATGGAGGITGVALFILYKLLNKHIRSKCCGNTIEIDIHTPKNIEVKVDEAPIHHSAPTKGNDERPSRSSGSKDISREESKETSRETGECCSSSHFTTENPLTISVPKPL